MLASTLHELSHKALELWRSVRDWVMAKPPEEARCFHFSRRELREHTGLEDHRLRECVAELTEMEYLETISGNGGKQFRYALAVHDQKGGRLPVLTPEELTAKIG